MDTESDRRQFLATLLVAVGLTMSGPSDSRFPSIADSTFGPAGQASCKCSRPVVDCELLATLADSVEIRDRRRTRSQYEPTAGMKFIATDTGCVSIGDGTAWRPLLPPGSVSGSDIDSPNNVEYVDPADGYAGLLEAFERVGESPCTVVIGPGRIGDIDGNVTLPANTWLRGEGIDATTLSFADGAEPDLAGLLRITGDNVRVSDLELDGNRSAVSLGQGHGGQAYGVYTTGVRHVTIESVSSHSFPGYGFDPHASGSRSSEYVTIRNCRAENNGLDGVTLAGVEHGVVVGTISVGNDRHGINLTDTEGQTVRVLNNTVAENGGTGVVVQNNTDGVTVSNSTIVSNGIDGIRIGNSGARTESVLVTATCIAENGGYGVNIRPARSVTISQCDISTNSRRGTETAEIAMTADGTATDIVITGNRIRVRAETDHGIDERSGNGPSLVTNNLVRGSADVAIATSHPETVESANLTH